jgi:hypothetical protein
MFVVTEPPRRESPLLRLPRRDPTLCNTSVYAILSPKMYVIFFQGLSCTTPPMIRRIDSGSLQRSATTNGELWCQVASGTTRR